ncbi:hypothetical protein THYS13_19350 [Thermoanaerobacter sp. YS13]|nr:hypothetical protein THYS13_19350 [Thermoanaerobacter sp. YS13]
MNFQRGMLKCIFFFFCKVLTKCMRLAIITIKIAKTIAQKFAQGNVYINTFIFLQFMKATAPKKWRWDLKLVF